MEELRDVYDCFQLYYGTEMTKVHEWEQSGAPTEVTKFKHAGASNKYTVCVDGLEIVRLHENISLILDVHAGRPW